MALFLQIAIVSSVLAVCGAGAFSYLHTSEGDGMKKGYDIKKTGLVPIYPDGYACSELTSFYASWLDVDGTHRDEIHSGVDGGKLGEKILAPAAGTVRAVWEADWQWGKEGALVLVHSASDLNMEGEGGAFYYSVYDHLKYDEIKHLKVGQKIARGEPLAHVYRPGGHAKYLPEVHWEVWEVQEDEMDWTVNRHGGREWRNDAARLIDPLYMLGIHSPPADKKSVAIVPFEPKRDYSDFRGFTYIFECRKS